MTWLARLAALVVLAATCFAVWLRLSEIASYVPDTGDEWGNTMAPFRVLYERGDPGTFFHPSLYYYTTALVYAFAYAIAVLFGAVDASASMTDLFVLQEHLFIWLARGVSLFFSTLTLAAVYRLASRLWGASPGLLAMVLVAFDPLQIHYSRTVRVDPMAVFLFVVAVDSVLRAFDRAAHQTKQGTVAGDFLRAGGLVGFAVAANYSAGLLVVWLAGAIWLCRGLTVGERRRLCWLAPFVSFAVFLVLNPYVLIDFDHFQRDFAFIAGLSVFEHTGWEGRDPGYYLQQLYASVPWFTGLVAAALALLFLFGGRRERLLCGLPLGYLAVFSILVSSKDLRFLLPALPLFAVAVGGAVSRVDRALSVRWLRPLWWVAVAAVVSLCAREMYCEATRPGHEMLAPPAESLFAWMEDHVPPRSRVVVESGLVSLLDTLGEPGLLAERLQQSLARVRPGLDQEYTGAVYIGGCNYAPEKVAKGEVDFAIVSRRNIDSVGRRCSEFPKVCEFYDELRRVGELVFEAPPGTEPVLVYRVRVSG